MFSLIQGVLHRWILSSYDSSLFCRITCDSLGLIGRSKYRIYKSWFLFRSYLTNPKHLYFLLASWLTSIWYFFTDNEVEHSHAADVSIHIWTPPPRIVGGTIYNYELNKSIKTEQRQQVRKLDSYVNNNMVEGPVNSLLLDGFGKFVQKHYAEETLQPISEKNEESEMNLEARSESHAEKAIFFQQQLEELSLLLSDLPDTPTSDQSHSSALIRETESLSHLQQSPLHH